ncbi:MAG: A/G-specific adenine glycosylase [Oscillatoriales cyanobacterium]|nr:MAG: A/G-specific adenine glycosylase [Oscillatoriales cyanobacterium]
MPTRTGSPTTSQNSSEPLPVSAAVLQRSLLDWYDRQGRDLPWRKPPDVLDPYRVWVSEIALQQTQVKTVLPYYYRWFDRFPTIADLARADQQAVLKAWEGLGYYSRARNLHRAAQIVMERHGGQFPQTLAEAIALPGIGRTTAGGILSSAFNLPLPILDGNVKRVLARLIALPLPPAKALDRLWAASEAVVSFDRPRDMNQALMDLGATVCTARKPACLVCPWMAYCQAYHTDRQQQIPVSEPKAPIPHKVIGVAVIRNEAGQILIDRRPAEGLLGGLWEFPGGKVEPNESIADCVRREIREELGIEIAVGEELIVVDHAYSHFKVSLHVHLCQHVSGEPQAIECDEVRWVTLDEINQFPFPKANTTIIEALKKRSPPTTP